MGGHVCHVAGGVTDRRYLFHAHHGGGWTLVLSAGLGRDLTVPDLTGEGSAPLSVAQPAANALFKFSDARINAIKTATGSSIGFWVTTPGSGTGLLGAEIFHRADCAFALHQLSSGVKATTCHFSTITYSESPTWGAGGHWWDNSSAYRWAFGYQNEGDRGTGNVCHATGVGLGAHNSTYGPFHRGWCSTQAWGQVWVK